MKLSQIAPDVWVNVGTGAITRVSIEFAQNMWIPTVFLCDGSKFGFSHQTLAEVVESLKSHE